MGAAMAPNMHLILTRSQLSFRAAVAATVSYGVAKGLSLPHPIYALIAAIIVTDFSPTETKKLGLQRLAATVIGAVCGVVMWVVFEPAEWTVGLGVFAAMVVCHILNVSGGAKVAGYVSALAMLNDGDQPWAFAWYRLIETVLGICVAWLLSLVPRLIELQEAPTKDPDRPA